MSRILLAILVIVGSWHQPSASASDDERLRSDLQEAVKARLFVVPIRIETTSSAKRGECASLGPEELTVSIRGKVLKDKVYRQKIKDGLITLDRRPRPMLHAMVFDTSGSMSMDLPDAKTAALAYLDNNLGDLDKGMVVGFDAASTAERAVESRTTLVAELHRAAPPPQPPDPSGTRSLPPRRPRWLVDRVEVEVRHDPELKKLFDKPNKALVGYELLKGSTRQPLRNGSGEPTAPGF